MFVNKVNITSKRNIIKVFLPIYGVFYGGNGVT